MDALGICQQCGRVLPENAPEGLCPACLAKAALATGAATLNATIDIGPLAAQAAPCAAASPPVRVRYFGDYELLEEIARGGMGVVYKARQVSLNRTVAVKMILAGQLAGDAEVKRFRVEAEAAAQLQHPNIVAIHEVGEHGGQHYFSMDFIGGTNLRAHMGNKALAIGEATRLMRFIAEAVHFAHQRGIVHRDLKPANVLLDESGHPHITDFGLAKRLECRESLTVSDTILGTPDYMSPEQAAGRQDIVGPSGDVFSLGAMLYEMITGRVPFRGANLAETLGKILNDDPVPPSRLNPRVPPGLETICLKCLEKRIDQRYTTAEALAKDLERFLNHEAVSARPLGRPQQIFRWLTDRPHVLAALACAGLLAFAWLGYGLWTENRLLVWENDHPGELKPISKWSMDPDLWKLLALGLFLLMLGLRDRLMKRRRARVMTGRFVSLRVLDAYALAGVVGIVLSICFGAAQIGGWRWAKHALPVLRGQLATEMAAQTKAAAPARLAEVSDLMKRQAAAQQEEQTSLTALIRLAKLSRQLAAQTDAAARAQREKVNEEINEIQKRLTNASQTALGSARAARAILEAKPALETNNMLVSAPVILKRLKIKELEKPAAPAAVTFSLLAATAAAWVGATVVLTALREERFAFYHSAQEEQSARSLALLEEQQAAELERRRMWRAICWLIIPASVLLLVFPYLLWGADAELSWKVTLLLGDVSACALTFLSSLGAWRDSLRWLWLNRVLLALASLIAVAALLCGPAWQVWQSIGYGATAGVFPGLFIRRARKFKPAQFPNAP
jgi:serine/threonine protein kinase